MTEILNKSIGSCMRLFVVELVQFSPLNRRKTKEMLNGAALLKAPPPLVILNGASVERVATFKLLGVHFASDLKWTNHIEPISRKVASRLYFLKQLKRATAAGLNDLLSFYPRDAMLARSLRQRRVRTSVCPSVRPSHAGIVRKRCILDTTLLWDGNRKPCASYRVVSLSMTLSDP